MKKTAIFLNLIFLGVSLNAQWGWNLQFNAPVTRITDVMFVNDNTGYASAYFYNPTSYGKLLKTTNSGLSWNIIDLDSAGGLGLPAPVALYFVNANTGFVLGGNICKTTNGGVNFSVVYQNGSILTNMQFINEQTGWVTGFLGPGNASVLRTTNSGVNWQLIPVSSLGPFMSIHFVNLTTGWICNKAEDYPSVFKSTDGGLSWVNQFQTTTPSGNCIRFFDENNGFSFGWKGIIGGTATFVRKTTNSGLNWYNSGDYGDAYVKDAYFVSNSTTGWICGGNGSNDESLGKILMTTNTGVNWILQTYENSPANSFYGLCFANSSTGWAVAGTRIYKTTTGGVTFIQPISNEVPKDYTLGLNYPNPFNPLTVISFSLPKDEYVELKIYDALGNEVTTLVKEPVRKGKYSVTFDASQFASGVYFYKLTAGSFAESKKMVLIK